MSTSSSDREGKEGGKEKQRWRKESGAAPSINKRLIHRSREGVRGGVGKKGKNDRLICLFLKIKIGVDSYGLISICYHQQTSLFTIVSVE